MNTRTEEMLELLSDCEGAARMQGWAGDGYEHTAEDLEWVIEILGRKPTRDEWVDGGLPNVGTEHVASVAPPLSEVDRALMLVEGEEE